MSRRKQAELDARQGLASVNELAAFCGVSPATIYQWLHKGTAPKSYKVGRYRRFKWADVEDWLERQSGPMPVA
jgi:excisionase family DNA binding protein